MIDSLIALIFTILYLFWIATGNVWLLNIQFLNIGSIDFHYASFAKNVFIAEN